MVDKQRVLEFRDFLRDLKPSQFDNSIGITGPVPTYEQSLDREFSDAIQAGVAEWFALFDGDFNCTDQDVDGTWFWLTDDKADYVFYMAEQLELYHERVLRKLFALDAQRSDVLNILGHLLVMPSEEHVWCEIVGE